MSDNTEITNEPDTDGDGVSDYLDIDSDNDGIFDVVEGGDDSSDTNGDGVIDSNDTGYNDLDGDGMSDNTEPTTEPDSDSDGNPDFIELDSDEDGCFDVVEAGFTDNDLDGVLSSSPVSVNSNGSVSSGIDGYTTANDIDNNSIADFTEFGPNSVSSVSQTSCDTYDWNGSTYNVTGSYTYTTTNIAGCDSTVTLNLTITNSTIGSPETITACDSLDWNGTTYTSSGTYTYATLNSIGCDSTVTLNLTINNSSTGITENITSCDSLVWNGITYTKSGTYVYSTTNFLGCDSTVNLNLTITNSSSGITENITSCDSYDWNGLTFTNSGTYSYTTTNDAGCDSVVTLNLTIINSSVGIPQTITVCDSLVWNGTTYKTSGTYTYYTSNVAGCDSTITLNLTINNSTLGVSENITACDNYDWNGITYTTSGTYTYATLNSIGCDSTVTLNLTITNSTIGFPETIISCDSLVWNGSVYTATGNYSTTITASNGCDSTAYLALTIASPSYTSNSLEICYGDSALLGGSYQTNNGTYFDSLLTTNGCDSIIETILNVGSLIYSFDTVEVCFGDSAFIAGSYQKVSGTYFDSYSSSNGCDSLVEVQFNVRPLNLFSLYTTICNYDSILLAGSYQYSSGTYYDTLTSIFGCDSIIQTNLVVENLPISSDSVSICSGDSIVIGGSYQLNPGNYFDTLVSLAGCDSIVEITLSLKPTNTVTDSISICSDDSVLIGGGYQFSSGVYSDTLSNIYGCDSVINTTLTVLPIYYSSDSSTICFDDSVQIGNNYYSLSGIYYDTLSSLNGCDSIKEFSLTVLTPNPGSDTVAIACDSLIWRGSVYKSSGVYSDTLQSTAGCDSILRLNLLINSSYTDTVVLAGCDSVNWTGIQYYSSGLYVDSLQNTVGCDSIIYLDLTINNSYNSDTTSLIGCDSVLWRGASYSSSGFYNDTLRSINGCDSILTLDLVINNGLQVDTSIIACDSILWNGFHYNNSGIYIDTLQTLAGCDSIITLNLLVNYSVASNDSIEICFGDSIFAGGAYQNLSGTYKDTLLNQSGCDSVITTHLEVNPQITNNQTLEICNGDSIYLEGSYQSSNGTFVDTLLSSNSCDSIIFTVLNVNPIYIIYDSISICYGDSALISGSYQTLTGTFYDTLVSQNLCDSIVVSLLTVDSLIETFDTLKLCFGDSSFLAGSFQINSGDYVDIFSSISGCDSVVKTNLEISPYLSSVDTLKLCIGDSAYLSSNYQTSSGVYYDTIQSINNCDSVVETLLIIDSVILTYSNSEICFDDSILLAGIYQNISGTYYDTLISSSGCDSILITDLNVIQQQFEIDTVSLCFGDSAIINGNYQNSAGIYYDTLSSSFGCDSIFITHLIFDTILYGYDSISLCYGDSAFIFGNYQSNSGIYSDTLVGQGGCDSVHITTLEIKPLIYVFDSLFICNGDSAFLAGDYQINSGIYIDSLSSLSGCDSIVETNLIIDSIIYGNDLLSICFGDSALIEGDYQTSSGTYNDTLIAHGGCDSVVSTILIIKNQIEYLDTLSICDGDSILISGSYQSISGDYIDSLTSFEGCDSIVFTNLSVIPVSITIDSIQICDGDSILIGGNYQNNAGTYFDTLQSVIGCDSIIETHLNINNIYSNIQIISICYSDSILLAGNYQNSSGTYFDTLQTIQGCDSIIQTQLNIDSTIEIQQSYTICSNDSIMVLNNYYSLAGIYYDTIYVNGSCDTVLVTNLNSNFIFQDSLTLTICDEFITISGDSINSSGVYYDSLQSINGCDSVIVYDLTINQSSISALSDTTCAPYTSPAGNIYTTSGFYTDTLINSVGCDSLIIIELTIFCDDIDGDGIPNNVDIDNDNDGISDVDEGNGDSDGDGIPDYLDLDSDNDGIYDIVESGNGNLDTNGDGVIDGNDNGFNDNDNNGMADGAQGTTQNDTDGDGIADYLDLDSDNDGIFDVIEGGDGNQDTNNDGVVDANDAGYSDTDGDGMADATEPTIEPDTDNDGKPDFIDLDSDNDGIYDVVEGGDGDLDTNGDGMVNDNDTGFSDLDNDGMADATEPTIAADTDNNGNPDYIDLDSDGDGCDDVIEAGFTDEDGDGYLGISPVIEDSLGMVTGSFNGYTFPADNDNNGVFDFLEEGSEATFTDQPYAIQVYNDGDDIIISAEASSISNIIYQWQYSNDQGATWINLADDTLNGTMFTGSNTSTLQMYGVDKIFDNNSFQLMASTPGFPCGEDQYSDPSTLELTELFVPQGFSPNGDGINDTWHITGIDRFPFNRVEVYNRWELKVYEKDGYNSSEEWDGKSNIGGVVVGTGELPEGTYYYIIEPNENGSSGSKSVKGYVYIRR